MRGDLLPAGSMGPKVEAACRFVEATGKKAVIGRLEDAEAMFLGKAGTMIVPTGCRPGQSLKVNE